MLVRRYGFFSTWPLLCLFQWSSYLVVRFLVWLKLYSNSCMCDCHKSIGIDLNIDLKVQLLTIECYVLTTQGFMQIINKTFCPKCAIFIIKLLLSLWGLKVHSAQTEYCCMNLFTLYCYVWKLKLKVETYLHFYRVHSLVVCTILYPDQAYRNQTTARQNEKTRWVFIKLIHEWRCEVARGWSTLLLVTLQKKSKYLCVEWLW